MILVFFVATLGNGDDLKRATMMVVGFAIAAVMAAVAWRGPVAIFTEPERIAHRKHGATYAALEIRDVGTLPPELHESSGLAVSRVQPGVLWSHNDSGDSPNLYAVNQSGRLLATIEVRNGRAIDWEDISSGPCPSTISMSQCLYIADTGNNSRARDTFTIYIVAEPEVAASGAHARTVRAESLRFRYPDFSRDSEAIAVHPEGDVTIVTKGQSGTIDLFGIDAAGVDRAISSRETVVVERLGSGMKPDGRIGRLATGAAISPDGTTLAVRTGNEVFFYAEARDERGRRTWRDLERPCYFGDIEPQGEAIDYLDDKTLLLTSESRLIARGRITAVRCR